MPDRKITYEIQEHFGTIARYDGGWNKELNLISWNGGAAKFDIREWDEHHERMKRGVTLTPWEMRRVVDLYIARNNDAAVARGRAIEAERNARRIAARKKADEDNGNAGVNESQEETSREECAADEAERQAQVEAEALEGAMPPEEEENHITA